MDRPKKTPVAAADPGRNDDRPAATRAAGGFGRPRAGESHLADAYAEFIDLADRLGMPEDERCGVLGLDRHGWPGRPAPLGAGGQHVDPAFVRRLGYALPLMRRLVANLAAPEDRADGAVWPIPFRRRLDA